VAEEIVFEEITTGAGNDIERATDMARKMVCEWGMAPEIGPLAYKRESQTGMRYPVSEETALRIDTAVNGIVQSAYGRVFELLTENREKLEGITSALLERETIDREDLQAIVGPRK